MSRTSVFYICLLASASIPSVAWAQTSAAGQSDDQGASAPYSGEIIVTAQRRDQSLQDVPITMTATSAEVLEAKGISESFDLPKVTPGLTMTTTRNGITPFLRGIGTQSSTSEQAVAIYVDNVYIASTAAAMFAFNNIERVEVLKGPQGTLFGRNATGGLINVITLDPSYTPEVKASIGYGNYDTFTASVYATGGLTENIAADIAGYVSHQGNGYGINQFLGNDVNITQTYSVRSKIRAELGDSTDITIAGDYARTKSDFGNAFQTQQGTLAFDGTPAIGSFHDTNSTVPGGTTFATEQWGASLTINHDFLDQLSLTSITAYRDNKYPSATDSDYSPVNLVTGEFVELSDTFQQELLLNGELGDFLFTAGAFYFHYERGMQPLVITSDVPPIRSFRDTNVVTDSYSVFGQGTYALGPRTNFTAGVRYTKEDTDVQGQISAADANGMPTTVTFDTATRTDGVSNSDSASKLTWRFSLDHKLTDDVLLYASANRGFKSGSYNSFAINDPPTDPETLDAYEIGIKSDLLDGALRLNAAAFYYDYKDIQVSAQRPSVGGVPSVGTINTNAAAGKIKGFEMDVVLSLPVSIGTFEISGGLSILDAEYKSFPGASSFIPNVSINGVPTSGNALCAIAASGGDFSGTLTGGNTACTLDATGKDMIKTPKFSGTIATNYSFPVNSNMDFGLNLSLQHTGSFHWDPFNVFENASYNVVSGQISLTDADEAWGIRLWGRNLTDTEYYFQVGPATTGVGSTAAAPRTYGITLDLKFGGR